MTCLQAAALLPLVGSKSNGKDHSSMLLLSQIVLSLKFCVPAAVAAYPERGQREGPPIREDPTDHAHASYLEWIGLNPNLVRI